MIDVINTLENVLSSLLQNFLFPPTTANDDEDEKNSIVANAPVVRLSRFSAQLGLNIKKVS
jgi:hypothetical protein